MDKDSLYGPGRKREQTVGVFIFSTAVAIRLLD